MKNKKKEINQNVANVPVGNNITNSNKSVISCKMELIYTSFEWFGHLYAITHPMAKLCKSN